MAEWEASGRFEFQAGRAAARAVAAARGVGLGLVCAQGAVGAEVSRSDGGGNGPGAAARGVQPAAGGAPEAGGRRRPGVAGRDPRGGGQDVRQVTSPPAALPSAPRRADSPALSSAPPPRSHYNDQPELMPKTPSQKNRKRRKRPSALRGESLELGRRR